MTSWISGRLLGFDLETTGVDPLSDRIVTACIVEIDLPQPRVDHTWLVDPGVPISAGAAAVHGITTERARAEGAPPEQAISEIIEVLAAAQLEGVPVIAFNARFDLTMLDREAHRHGLESLSDHVGGHDQLRVIDPLVLDKHVDTYRPGSRRLGDVCAHYGIALDAAHTAEADALAAVRLAWRLGKRHPAIGDVDSDVLHGLQVEWARAQGESLRAHFDQQGRSEHVDIIWPVIPADA